MGVVNHYIATFEKLAEFCVNFFPGFGRRVVVTRTMKTDTNKRLKLVACIHISTHRAKPKLAQLASQWVQLGVARKVALLVSEHDVVMVLPRIYALQQPVNMLVGIYNLAASVRLFKLFAKQPKCLTFGQLHFDYLEEYEPF